MTSREVRDPIHGLITLEPSEWRIVDSPAFQRLRGVQQLAFTHLVYPGARHSRFEHCIGAAHIAGHVATTLKVDDPSQLRAAGLCHDLGHGAFSHVSEMVYENLTGRSHIHESISAAIVQHHAPIRKALGRDLSGWVADLLSGKGHGASRSFERDVIAGPADIDKLDYLLRDSHFCGVNYGRFDLHKVVEAMRKIDDITGTYLGFDPEGVYAVEELLLARYHMHRQVYGHRTRVATDKMLVRAMSFGVDESVLPRSVFSPPPEPDDEFVAEYLTWDDHKVIHTLLNAPEGSKARALMEALMARRLLKETDRISYEELEQTHGMLIAANAVKPKKLDQSLADAEKLVAAAAGVDPMWVVFHWESLKSPIASEDSLSIADSQVAILDKTGGVSSLNRISDIFGETEKRPRLSVVVYILEPGKPFTGQLKKKINTAFTEALMLIAKTSASI